MSQPTTAVVDIERIDVEDGFNPRTRFDEDRLSELEATIRRDGLLTALTVVPSKGDRYTLIAGERRWIAARRAGLRKVPVVLRANRKGSRAAALVENLIREDLDPIDIAQGLADLAETENLTTHRQIAERIGKTNVGWVSEHLRLLRLPERVQHHIAAGHVPIAAEKVLREASKVSPRIAECACELAARGTVDGRDLLDHFGEVLQQVAVGSFTDKPTMIGVHSGAMLSKLIADPGKRSELLDRLVAVDPFANTVDEAIRFGDAEIDAARAAGCLIEHRVEHNGWISTVSYITDAELAADLAVRVIEQTERGAAEEAERRAKERGRKAANEPIRRRHVRSARKRSVKPKRHETTTCSSAATCSPGAGPRAARTTASLGQRPWRRSCSPITPIWPAPG